MDIFTLVSSDLNKEAMNNADKLATTEFIEKALKEMDKFITTIETEHNTVLLGDRSDFKRAKTDWKQFTYAQVSYAVSTWKHGILERYSK